MSSEASYLSDELKKAQARIADEKAKNGQLEHALASLRASFDAIQGVSLVQSVWRIRELEADASKAERNFRNQISAAQSKNAKQRTVLAKLNEREKRTRESIQDAREDSTREYLGRVSELEEREKAEARIKELESDAAARAKVRERLVESINVKAAQVQELEANLAFYQEKEEKDNAKIAQFIQRIQELALALERQRGHAKNLQFRLNEMPGNEALDRARCERDDALVRIKEMEGAIECLKIRVGNDEWSRRELSRKLDGRRTHILRLEKTVFNLEHFLAVAWKKIDELNAPK